MGFGDPIRSFVGHAVPSEPGESPAGRGSNATLRSSSTLVAGLAAGVVAWLGSEATHDVFRPATEQITLMGVGRVTTVTNTTQAIADRKNVALASGLWGAALGLALGLAGGPIRRSAVWAPRAALAGLALGGVVGSGGGPGPGADLPPLLSRCRAGVAARPRDEIDAGSRLSAGSGDGKLVWPILKIRYFFRVNP